MAEETAPVTPHVDPEIPTEEEIAQERAIARRPLSIDALTISDPRRAREVLEARVEILASMRAAAFRATVGRDWTVTRAKDGSQVATLRRSGAEKIAKVWGIRFVPRGPAGVRLDGKRRIAEVFADAFCSLTQEEVTEVRGYRVSTEAFVGRTGERGTPDVGDEDLKQSAMTAAFTKSVRVLAAVSAVEVGELARVWDCAEDEVTRRCVRGTGFGSAAEREHERGPTGGEAPTEGAINEGQRKRLWAITCKRAEALGLKPDAIARAILRGAGIAVGDDGSTRAAADTIPIAKYESICKAAEEYEPEGAKAGGAS